MKRKLLHAVLVASMAVALSGCGNTSGINADAEETQKATETENIEEERGTEGAAAEQKENTTGTPDENGNYLINGSFEEPDFSGWTVTNNNDVTEELDVYDRETDCFAGAQSLHFYSGNNPVDFSMKQTVSGLEDGTYKLTAHIQGDAAGDENPTVYFYALVDGEEVKADGKLQGYVNWYEVNQERKQSRHRIQRGTREISDPRRLNVLQKICGPPGSGRSNMARAFAAALESPDHGMSDEPTRVTQQVLAVHGR